jgi:hypothetical protein
MHEDGKSMSPNTRSEIKRFGQEFMQGLREAPLVFFAPVIAIFRLVDSTTNDLMRESEERHRRRVRARARLR